MLILIAKNEMCHKYYFKVYFSFDYTNLQRVEKIHDSNVNL